MSYKSQHVWFERYADDAVIHCRARQEMEYILERVRQRLKDCDLTLPPDKDETGVLHEECGQAGKA